MQNEMPDVIYTNNRYVYTENSVYEYDKRTNLFTYAKDHPECAKYIRADLVTVPPDDAQRALEAFNAFVYYDRGYRYSDLHANACDLLIENEQTIRRALTSHAENERLRKALEFYADPSDYKSPFTGGLGKLYFDCGEIAREALSHAAKSDGGE